MTLAISHVEGERIVLDFIGERKAPFSPVERRRRVRGVLKQYRLSTVRGDRYAGEWPRRGFSGSRRELPAFGLNRSEIYLATLPLLNSGRVCLLDNQRMAAQFLGLERRTSRGGRDTVNHAPGSHDDVANSVAGSLVLALENAGYSFEAWARVFAGNGEPEVADEPDPLPWRPSKQERARRDGTADGDDGGGNPCIEAYRRGLSWGDRFIRPGREHVPGLRPSDLVWPNQSEGTENGLGINDVIRGRRGDDDRRIH